MIQLKIRNEQFQLEELKIADKAPDSLLSNLSQGHPSYNGDNKEFIFQR